MTPKIRVLFLIPNYGFGGAQKVLADHSLLLDGKAEVLEAVFNDWDEKRVYETGHPYKSLGVSGGGNPIARIGNFLRRISRLKALKREFRPDVTISHLEGADYISLLSGGSDRKVIVIHGSKIGDQNITGVKGAIRHKLLMPWLYKKADRIITVSGAIREELVRHYELDASKIISLPNFFDCKAIAEKAAEPIPESFLPAFARKESFKLITFARLAAQKNLAALFPVIKVLKDRGLDIQLYVIGDGELRQPLLEAASGAGAVWDAWNGTALNQESDIYFLGYQPAPQPFLKHAHLYLMTSLWEGFPMALCEAMASGIPVMAADCPTGPAEILGEGVSNPAHGLLPAGGLMPMIRDAQDAAAISTWADAIQTLIAERARLGAMKEQGLRRVQYYDRGFVGQEWIKAYLEA